MKEKGNPNPWKPPNIWNNQWSWRDLQDAEESKEAGLRTKNQNERSTDHLNHWCRHHRLRSSGGKGSLRPRLWRSVSGSRLALAVWRQPKSLGSGTPWAGKEVH